MGQVYSKEDFSLVSEKKQLCIHFKKACLNIFYASLSFYLLGSSSNHRAQKTHVSKVEEEGREDWAGDKVGKPMMPIYNFLKYQAAACW